MKYQIYVYFRTIFKNKRVIAILLFHIAFAILLMTNNNMNYLYYILGDYNLYKIGIIGYLWFLYNILEFIYIIDQFYTYDFQNSLSFVITRIKVKDILKYKLIIVFFSFLFIKIMLFTIFTIFCDFNVAYIKSLIINILSYVILYVIYLTAFNLYLKKEMAFNARTKRRIWDN